MDLLVLGVYGVFGEWLRCSQQQSAASRPMSGRSCTAMWLPSPSPNTFRSAWLVAACGAWRWFRLRGRSTTARCRVTVVALRETEHHSDVVLASGVGKFEGEGWRDLLASLALRCGCGCGVS